MSKTLFDQLDNIITQRDWADERATMDEMADIYEGKLPQQYEQFFPRSVPKQLIQVIPLAWDDLATSAGRLPDLRGEPKNQTRQELNAIGLQEKIAFSYLRDAQPTGKQFMRDLAWWLQIGRAVAVVVPDWENQRPSFELRDPRTAFPGVKKMVNNTIVELYDIMFKYEMDLDTAVERKLAPESKRDAAGGSLGPKVKIIEYIDENQWALVSEHGQMMRGNHNLGKVPAKIFQSFTPNGKAGRSRFKDQIALMVSISRLITAKIAFADRLVNPILWTKGHETALELGPYVINKLGPSGEMGQIAPPTQFQVDRDIQLLNQFSRVLNRNPEVRQGEIAQKGSYTSAKTLEQLSESIDTVVGADWDIIGPGIQYLMMIAFMMDVKLWPNVEKTIMGTIKGKSFLETYTPAKDIGERTFIRVEYGFGVGGYQGFLMHLQAKDAETMSRRTAMEAMPGVTDVDEEMQLIDIEAMDAAGKAMFMNQAAAGQLDMVVWSKLRKEMATKGLPLHEAIEKYQEELAAQAAAAAQSEQAALTAPAAEDAPPEDAPLPGIPPAALAGV